MATRKRKSEKAARPDRSRLAAGAAAPDVRNRERTRSARSVKKTPAPAPSARAVVEKHPMVMKRMANRLTSAKSRAAPPLRTLDARADTLDFRDRMFEPSLVEVPAEIPLSAFLRLKLPVLDQGSEGACTGYGLATVALSLLARRKVKPDRTPVSPRMLYEMARRYDEWPGENYSGSSARGAMKGWFKQGLCSEASWPGTPLKRTPKSGTNGSADMMDPVGLNAARTADALRRPLGAYLRVNHKDLIAMHCALAEVGVLYATAAVHANWQQVGKDGIIDWPAPLTGGHAFAIVAFDQDGFWIQNSWGKGWGRGGMGRISYDDWLVNGTDVWVARLGAPVTLRLSPSSAIAHSAAAGESAGYSFADLRPHIVSLGNDGRLQPGGENGTSAAELAQIFRDDIPRVMDQWQGQRHLLLYAHGGLVDARSAAQRLADYRAPMLAAQIYPVSFLWHSDMWSSLTNVLEDAMRRRRPEGFFGSAKNFMLERLDDTLEILTRSLGGKTIWDQMKQNAQAASDAGSGARLVLDELAQLAKTHDFELHLVGHSAGAIFQAPLARLATSEGPIPSGYLQGQTGYGMKVTSCTLWAPACTTELLRQAYLPAIDAGQIARFALFALTDAAERADNVAALYNKSLLYLVARAFEQSAFGEGTPIAGMEKFLRADAEIMARFATPACELVLAPNTAPTGSLYASRSRHHGDFDDDADTVAAMLARVAGAAPAQGHIAAPGELVFHRSGSSFKDRRDVIERKTRAV